MFGARAGHHAAGKDMKTAEIQTGPSAKSEPGDVEPPVDPGAIDASSGDVAADGAAIEPKAVLESTVEQDASASRTSSNPTASTTPRSAQTYRRR